jgi:hypothetical protein
MSEIQLRDRHKNEWRRYGVAVDMCTFPGVEATRPSDRRQLPCGSIVPTRVHRAYKSEGISSPGSQVGRNVGPDTRCHPNSGQCRSSTPMAKWPSRAQVSFCAARLAVKNVTSRFGDSRGKLRQLDGLAKHSFPGEPRHGRRLRRVGAKKLELLTQLADPEVLQQRRRSSSRLKSVRSTARHI